MNAGDLASIILTLLSSAVIIVGGIRWYTQSQIQPVKDELAKMCEVIEDVRSETKTNGGSSMRDEIRSIKKEQEEAKEVRKEQKEKIDHLYDLFVEYLSKSK